MEFQGDNSCFSSRFIAEQFLSDLLSALYSLGIGTITMYACNVCR